LTNDFTLKLNKGAPFYEFIDDVLSHIVEGGIFMPKMERLFDKLKMLSKLEVHIFNDTYFAISFSHLKTAFYLLMLGYVLTVDCYVTVIMWHCYSSKVQERICTSIMNRHK
jgi:hypothetical protein